MARSLGNGDGAKKAGEDRLVQDYAEPAADAGIEENIPEEKQYVPEEEYDQPDEPASMPKKKKKGGRVAAAIIVVAAIAVGGFFVYSYLNEDRGLAADDAAAIVDNGTFYQGVSVLGADISGLTMAEARPQVEQKAQELIDGTTSAYSVEGTVYPLTAQQLGASVDVDAALMDAMMYGREGNFFERKDAIDAAAQGGARIDVPLSFDQQAILGAVSSNSAELTVAPVDAAVEMEKVSDEANKITDMNITYTDSVEGRGVDTDALAQKIYDAVSQGDFAPVEADIEVLQPKVTSEDIAALYTERGVYKTSYGDSAEGRRYNIWKMADIINGVKIEPGETWSINEEAGPRTYALGWKGAPGISEGVYKEEAGGGICQTNSTLYNAVIRAEVEIVDKTPHSWPLGYVPGGLDATISTGSPDFQIRNNYDVPIYIVCRTDGEDARTVEIAIYGPPYEDGLTRDFDSKEIETWGGGGTVEIPDPSLPAGQRVSVIGAHSGRKFLVTKYWKDADGNVVKSEEYDTVTYSPKPAQVRVGTGAAAGGGNLDASGNMPAWVQPENW